MKTLYIGSIAVLMMASCKNNTGVQEVKPVKKPITELVFATGGLEPENQYNLTVQADGYLSQVNFKEGDIVSAGQSIAYIDNKVNVVQAQTAQQQLQLSETTISDNAPALRQLEANMATLEQKIKQDEQQASRLKNMYESGSASKVDYENASLVAETSKGNLKALQSQYQSIKLQARQQYVNQQGVTKTNAVNSSYNSVKALIGGKVYKKLKQAGEFVRKGETIAVIGNPNTIFAMLNIDENSIAKVKLNQKVDIKLNTNSNKVYKGFVYEIYPSFNEVSQSFLCKVKFTDTLDFGIAGTQLEANIVVAEKSNALLIPRSYMSFGNSVTLKNDSIKTIVPGIVSSEWVEVLSGLSANDVLVPFKPKKK